MRTTLMWLAVIASAGCDYKSPFESNVDVRPPISTGSSVTFLDVGNREVVFVLPGDEKLDVNRVALGGQHDKPAWSVPTRDGKHLLVLTVPDSGKQEDVQEKLFRLAADGQGEPVPYEVRAPFDRIVLTPDYKRAVLYFGGNGSSAGTLQNANQVAIVRLDSSDGSEVVNFTINGFGGRLQSVHFPAQLELGMSQNIHVGGSSRDLAVFLAPGEVILVDMDDVNAAVALNFNQDTGFGFTPEGTLLRPGNELYETPVLFVRALNSSDVAMLSLVAQAIDPSQFTAQVNLLSVTTGCTDFAYHDDGDTPMLVTVDSDRGSLRFTDITKTEYFDVDLDGPASRLFIRDHDDDGTLVKQVVVWALESNIIHTLELDGIANSLNRKPRKLKIAGGIGTLVRLDNDRTLIGSGNELYVVDFSQEKITPLTSSQELDPTSSALERDMLYLGTAGHSAISSVDLVSLNPEDMLLDDPIQSFHYLSELKKIAVVHDDPVGHMTVANANDLSRSTSYTTWGFLLSGVLDRPDTRWGD